MAPKQKQARTGLPSAKEVLEAIHSRRGELCDTKNQNNFLRELLVPKYTQDLDDDGIKAKVAECRTWLRGIANSRSSGRKKKVVTYEPLKHGVQELFVDGPKKVLAEKYLAEEEVELSDDETDDEDESEEDADEEEASRHSKKRKAIPSTEDRDGSLGGKRQRIQDSSARKDSGTAQSVNRRNGSARADARMTPQMTPSRQPLIPSEIANDANQAWVEEHMQKLESALWNAMLACFQEYGINGKAISKFVIRPEPELRKLYETLCEGTWEMWTIDMANEPDFTQDYSMMGLLGAAVLQEVFRAELRWNLQQTVVKALGENLKYFEQVIGDLGQDPEVVLKYMVARQIGDPKFQEKEVAAHAQELAGSLVMVLQPHIKQLTKLTESGEEDLDHKRWIGSLKTAFQEALVIKQTLRASRLGPFGVRWAKAGSQLNRDEHRGMFEIGGSERVLHSILPSVFRKRDSGPLFFSKNLVVPMEPPIQMEPPGTEQ